MPTDQEVLDSAYKAYKAGSAKRGEEHPDTVQRRAKYKILLESMTEGGKPKSASQGDNGSKAVSKAEALRKAMEKKRKKE